MYVEPAAVIGTVVGEPPIVHEEVTDATPVARTVLWLLSDWSRGVSGELIHVDGGFHAMGSDLVSLEEQAQAVATDAAEAAEAAKAEQSANAKG